jgi:uncharacterized protein involved in exopolysaccharide biosynthesis
MNEENINIFKYIKLLAHNWKFISLITIMSSILAVLISIFLLKDIYRSTAVLMPSSASNSGISSASSSLGGIAAMTGIDIGSDSIDKTKLANQLLISLDFYSKLYNSDNNFLINLIAADYYDKKLKKIIFNKRIYDSKNSFWLYYDKTSNKKPSIQDTHGDFLAIVNFEQDLKTKFVNISVQHKSPVFANELLKKIIYELNEQIRVFDNFEAKKSIDFIIDKSNDTTSATFRKTINDMYNSQLHKLMLTEVSDDYAFRIIETPVIPEKKFLPIRSLIVLLSAIMSGMLAILYILVTKDIAEDLS